VDDTDEAGASPERPSILYLPKQGRDQTTAADWITDRYKGIPTVILTGNVIANAMGRYKPGFACGTAIFMAAGTAM
jgi:hypothetical protein